MSRGARLFHGQQTGFATVQLPRKKIIGCDQGQRVALIFVGRIGLARMNEGVERWKVRPLIERNRNGGMIGALAIEQDVERDSLRALRG